MQTFQEWWDAQDLDNEWVMSYCRNAWFAAAAGYNCTPPEGGRAAAFIEAANIVRAMRMDTVMSKYVTPGECHAARHALLSAAEGLQAAAEAMSGPQSREG